MQPPQICIGPTIRIGRESWCLPYAGVFFRGQNLPSKNLCRAMHTCTDPTKSQPRPTKDLAETQYRPNTDKTQN